MIYSHTESILIVRVDVRSHCEYILARTYKIVTFCLTQGCNTSVMSESRPGASSAFVRPRPKMDAAIVAHQRLRRTLRKQQMVG